MFSWSEAAVQGGVPLEVKPGGRTWGRASRVIRALASPDQQDVDQITELPSPNLWVDAVSGGGSPIGWAECGDGSPRGGALQTLKWGWRASGTRLMRWSSIHDFFGDVNILHKQLLVQVPLPQLLKIYNADLVWSVV